MHKSSNDKDSLVLTLMAVALVAIMAFICYMMTETAEAEEPQANVSGRFLTAPSTVSFSEAIIVDQSTGVQYLVVYGSDSIAVTPLVSADGTYLTEG